MLKPCSEKRVPQAKKHVPSTNTTSISQIGRSGLINIHLHRLRRIEPTTENATQSVTQKYKRAAQRNVVLGRGTTPRRNVSWAWRMSTENGMHDDICSRMSRMTTAIFAASLSFLPLTCCGFDRIWQSIRGCCTASQTLRRNECSRYDCTTVSSHFTSAMICKYN
jgi:hypothetical protein